MKVTNVSLDITSATLIQFRGNQKWMKSPLHAGLHERSRSLWLTKLTYMVEPPSLYFEVLRAGPRSVIGEPCAFSSTLACISLIYVQTFIRRSKEALSPSVETRLPGCTEDTDKKSGTTHRGRWPVKAATFRVHSRPRHENIPLARPG